VKMGTTANQRKLSFNLRKAKSRMSVLEDGDLHPDQVRLIAKRRARCCRHEPPHRWRPVAQFADR
jgi:hypothetical protein